MEFSTQKRYLLKINQAEWAEAQSTFIPSNIKVNIPTNLEADNIDWQNKGLIGKEQTHNTNSILIQQTDASEARQSSIQLNLTKL